MVIGRYKFEQFEESIWKPTQQLRFEKMLNDNPYQVDLSVDCLSACFVAVVFPLTIIFSLVYFEVEQKSMPFIKHFRVLVKSLWTIKQSDNCTVCVWVILILRSIETVNDCDTGIVGHAMTNGVEDPHVSEQQNGFSIRHNVPPYFKI